MSNPGTRRSLLMLTTAAVLLATAAPSWAGGGQHYPNGSSDFLGGILPPQPGFYMINYLALIQKERLMGTTGATPGFGNDDDKKAPLDFKADVMAEVPRFIWVSPYKILGANYGAQFFFPTYDADVKAKRGGDTLIDDQDRGVGDIIFAPIILGFHFSPNFHMVVAEDIWAPTGDYDADKAATQILSRNHWTFETVVAATYLIGGLDLSAKLMYDFNTKNDKFVVDPFTAFEIGDPSLIGEEVDLEPGQEFHVDYGVSYGRSMEFRYGISGYYYQQVTEDKVDGESDGRKSRIAAAGPTFKYWPAMGKWQLTLKHLWEFAAKDMPEGSNTWLNATYAF